MKRVLLGLVIIGIIVLGMYYPIVWWITGIAILLIVVLFVWLICGSDKREEKRLIGKFGKDYKEAISKGKLGLRTPYPCTPDSYHTSKKGIEEIAKIQLPEFTIKECKETLPDFTGDYCGSADIEFDVPIDDNIIMQIEEDMKHRQSKWERWKDDSDYICHLLEPNLDVRPSQDVLWRLIIRKGSSKGEIVYGRI